MAKSQALKDAESQLLAMAADLTAARNERDEAQAARDEHYAKLQVTLAKYKEVLVRLAAAKMAPSSKDETMVLQVQKAVKRDLWRLVKFIGNEEQVRKAGLMVIDLLLIKDFLVTEEDPEEKQQEVQVAVEQWLTTYASDIRQANGEQRSYVQSEMKKIVLAFLKRVGKIPTPKEFFQLSQRNLSRTTPDQQADQEELFDFYVTLLSAVAGSATYGEKQRRTDPISACKTQDGKTAVTISTEAFLVVMYENCYNKWLNMHKWKEVDKNPGSIPKYSRVRHAQTQDFMAKFSDTLAGNSQYGGWSREGIEKFNAYIKAFKTLRETNSEGCRAEELLSVSRFKAAYDEERKRKRAENGLPEEDDLLENTRKKRARQPDDDDEEDIVADFDSDE